VRGVSVRALKAADVDRFGFGGENASALDGVVAILAVRMSCMPLRNSSIMSSYER